MRQFRRYDQALAPHRTRGLHGPRRGRLPGRGSPTPPRRSARASAGTSTASSTCSPMANFCLDFPDYSIGNVKSSSIEAVLNGEW